jgi:hypothetical protein
MSTDPNNIIGALEPEVISPQAISESIEQCFASSAPERALELATSEEEAVVEEAETDDDAQPEIETAEEISLKNGVYHEIRRKLSERYGIPQHEVAFIHEADTPARKAALFKAVNQGRVRVLLGSTSKLGTGVNVQRRLVALHHVDEPWKPAELEQREGRILRQGNIYPEVFIFHYVTERSFDGYMLQTLESKARFISQIMAGEVTARTAEDVGDMVLTVAQVKAIASGNPMVQKRIELEVKLVKLDRLRAAYYNNRAAMRADLEELPERIIAQGTELAGHEAAIKARLPLEEDSFRITLKKNIGEAETAIFDKRERAGAQLRLLADLLMERVRRGSSGMSLTEEVGLYRGFKVFVHVSGNSRFAHHSTLFNFQSEIHLRASNNGTSYVAQIGESNVGITQSIDYQLRHLEDRLEQSRSGLEMLEARLQTVQAEVDKPWAFAAEYRRLRRAYEKMGAALQSAGLEVESNTTFTEEEGDVEGDVEAQTECEAAQDCNQTDAATSDELSARRNPYTGLEDWAIITPVGSEEDYDSDESGEPDGLGSGTLSFDFAAGDASQVNGETGDTDIFLVQPDTNAGDDTSDEASNGEDFIRDDIFGSSTLGASATDGEFDEDEAASGEDSRPTTEDASKPKHIFVSKSVARRQPKGKSRKAHQPADTGQSTFLWS